MRDGWIRSPLPEVLDFREGPGILAKDFRPAGVPLLRLAGTKPGANVLAGCNFLDADMVERKWAHFRVSEGDVLLSTSASLGQVAIIPKHADGAIPYTGLIRMRPAGPHIAPEFIPWLLRSPDFASQVSSAGVGSVLNHFGPSHLRHMTLVVPPIEEQRRIAAVLGALDELIDTNRTLRSTGRELAKVAVATALKDAAVRRPLAEIANIERGLSYKGAGLADAGQPMVNMGSAENFGWLKRSGWKYYAGDFKPRHLASTTDVLVVNTEQTWRNEILGWPILIPSDVGSALFSHHVYKITLSADWEWMRLPVWGYLFTEEARGTLTGAVRGTTVANLPTDALQRLQVPLPQRSDSRIAAASVLLEAVWDSELEIARLESVRNELLPLLLSGVVSPGEVDVGAA